MNAVAIDKNLEALTRIVAMLVAMAGFAGLAFSPCGRQCRAEGETDWRAVGVLPRRLHTLILRTLRPAEAATRRLIVAMAQGLVVTLPPSRARPKPKQEYIEIHPSNVVRNGKGTGIVLPSNALRRIGPDNRVEMYLIPKALPALPTRDPVRRTITRTHNANFALLDPLRLSALRPRRRPVSVHTMPRIWSVGQPTLPAPIRRTSVPGAPLDATRLSQRLAALGSALADMPAQAQRFARWRARRDLGRTRRAWPLKPGRPPGGRLPYWDPDAKNPRNIREVDEVLAHCHSMALFALASPRRDSS